MTDDATKLVLAIQHGDRGKLERLLRHGADPNARTYSGISAAQIAARQNDPESYRILEKNGYSLGLEIDDHPNYNALILAFIQGNTELVNSVMPPDKPETCSNSAWNTALRQSCIEAGKVGNMALFRIVVDAYFDSERADQDRAANLISPMLCTLPPWAVNEIDRRAGNLTYGNTGKLRSRPLIELITDNVLYADNEYKTKIEALLDNDVDGMRPSAKNASGESPSQIAIRLLNVETLDRFLAHDTGWAKDSKTRTGLLQEAVESRSTECLELLLSYGLTPTELAEDPIGYANKVEANTSVRECLQRALEQQASQLGQSNQRGDISDKIDPPSPMPGRF